MIRFFRGLQQAENKQNVAARGRVVPHAARVYIDGLCQVVSNKFVSVHGLSSEAAAAVPIQVFVREQDQRTSCDLDAKAK